MRRKSFLATVFAAIFLPIKSLFSNTDKPKKLPWYLRQESRGDGVGVSPIYTYSNIDDSLRGIHIPLPKDSKEFNSWDNTSVIRFGGLKADKCLLVSEVKLETYFANCFELKRILDS